MQATIAETASDLAHDLCAVIAYLGKTCNSDVIEAVGALELSLTQIKLLHHLERADRALVLTEVADLVHVSLPAASRVVDDLVRRGLVERHEDATDRRMKRVSLTDAGRAIIRQIGAARLSGLQQFVEGLTEPERSALAQAVEKLMERPELAAWRP
jgi:DNA-binding MarR family transcriptional regulator